MFTSNPDPESCVIINQAAPHFKQAKTTEGHQSSAGSTNVPKHIAAFYKGQPEALGATQVFIGVVFIAFGISVTKACGYICRYMDFLVFSGVMFWSAIACIIAGSLSAAAAVKPTVGLVRSSLIVNIISSLFAAVAIILLTLSFFAYFPFYRELCARYPWGRECEGAFNFWAFTHGILGILIVFAVLMFCISISTAVFGCKTTCRTSFQEVTVVIYQTAPPPTDTSDTKTFSDVPGPSEIQEEAEY